MAMVLLSQQVLFIQWDGRAVTTTQMIAWAVLATANLAALLLNGGWFASREVRALANDELTRAHRSQAITGGFAAAMITAVLVFVVSPFEPITAQRAAHMIVSIGLAVALLSFGVLERRALG